jgi:hypothetical protein
MNIEVGWNYGIDIFWIGTVPEVDIFPSLEVYENMMNTHFVGGKIQSPQV